MVSFDLSKIRPGPKICRTKFRSLYENFKTISGNIDNPEGGFDALMQVMVCQKDVGWRNPSRKVIIYTTDQSFHIAMDGKLGGLVVPNDGQCHLDLNGNYTFR